MIISTLKNISGPAVETKTALNPTESTKVSKPYQKDSFSTTKAKKDNNDILFVGMDYSSPFELKTLKENISKTGNDIKVLSILNTAQITYKDAGGKSSVLIPVKDQAGNIYNLYKIDGIRDYVKTFGLPAGQSEKLVDIIDNFDEKSRDEIAGIACIWSEAEKGKNIPSRFVLSGHSTGNGIFGDNNFNGELTFATLEKLAKALPAAASQIEDIHLSGCYTGGKHSVYKFREIFPNLKTIWGYTNSAPGSASGATLHQSIWEKATRGNVTFLDRDIVANTRKGDSVSVWSEKGGYSDSKAKKSFTEIVKTTLDTESCFADYFTGEEDIYDPYSNKLRDFYDNLQDLLQQNELPEASRKDLEITKEKVIRLIFFKRIMENFSGIYNKEIKEAYQELGMAVPDFNFITRKKALLIIEQFEQQYNKTQNPSGNLSGIYNIYTRGLKDLDASLIPRSWI